MSGPDPKRGNLDDHVPEIPDFSGPDYAEYEDDDPEDDWEFDCHLGPDGQCGKAGSEECDWECPMRMSEFYAGSPAWIAKHSTKRKAK